MIEKQPAEEAGCRALREEQRGILSLSESHFCVSIERKEEALY